MIYFQNFSTNIFILDSAEEINIGIGRDLNLPELHKNEWYISKAFGTTLRLENNDIIKMEFRLSDLFGAFLGNESGQREDEKYNIKSNPYTTNSQINNNIDINNQQLIENLQKIKY